MKYVWRLVPIVALIITICDLVIIAAGRTQPALKPIEYPWVVGEKPLLYPSNCQQVSEIRQLEYWQCNGGDDDWFRFAWLELDWDRSLITVTYFARHNTINLGQISYEYGQYTIAGRHSWRWLRFGKSISVRLWDVESPITLFDEVLSIKFEGK